MLATRPLRKGPVLAIVLASYTMIVLDISIVITALPKIHHSLDFSPTTPAAATGIRHPKRQAHPPSAERQTGRTSTLRRRPRVLL